MAEPNTPGGAPANPEPAPTPVNAAPPEGTQNPQPANPPADQPADAKPAGIGSPPGDQPDEPAADAKPQGIGSVDATVPGQPQGAGAPEAYEAFKLPEGLNEVDEAISGDLMADFKAWGLSQEQAQFQVDHMLKYMAKLAEKHDAEVESRVAAWTDDAKRLGLMSNDNVTLATQVLANRDPGNQLLGLLQEHHLTTHPVLIQMLVDLGRRTIGDTGLATAGGVGSQPAPAAPTAQSTEEALWPGSTRAYVHH